MTGINESNQDAHRSRSYEAPPPSDSRYSVELAAGVEKTVAVPSGKNYAVFDANGADFYVAYDETAAVPSGDLTGTAPDRRPGSRFLGGVAEIHLISAAACRIQIDFYEG